MPWLRPDEMELIRIMRVDLAQKRDAYEVLPTEENQAEFEEAHERRARAIRSLVEEDERYNVRILSGIFKCRKDDVRKALGR